MRTSLSTQFLLAAGAVVGIAMIVLGNWASDRIERSATRGAAEAGAIFLQAFLQPYVQDLPATGSLPVEIETRLDALLEGGDIADRFIMLKIWRLDTTLLYASNKNVIRTEAVEEEIRTAASGQLARHFEELDEEVSGIRPEDNITLLEVYAPLYRTGTDEIIAVGEFYQSAVKLIDDGAQVRTLTWVVVGAITLSMLAVLFLIVARGSRTIVRQQRDLERQFADATVLAQQNDRLRQAAEQARIDATEANETFISRIGAEIHDGPIQTLSLLMLSLGDDRAPHAALGPHHVDPVLLAKSVYGELRNLSTGLLLPEIEKAELADIFDLVISRYEASTGSNVTRHIGRLPKDAPHAVKICCYRVVQEALTNGYRHAGGKNQMVRVRSNRKELLIAIGDRGAGIQDSNAPPQDERSSKLGLLGMQNRVRVLKGKLSIRSGPDLGTTVIVRLPLDPTEV